MAETVRNQKILRAIDTAQELLGNTHSDSADTTEPANSNLPKYMLDPEYSVAKLKKMSMFLSNEMKKAVFVSGASEEEQAGYLLILLKSVGAIQSSYKLENSLNTSKLSKSLATMEQFDTWLSEKRKTPGRPCNNNPSGDGIAHFIAITNFITAFSYPVNTWEAFRSNIYCKGTITPLIYRDIQHRHYEIPAQYNDTQVFIYITVINNNIAHIGVMTPIASEVIRYLQYARVMNDTVPLSNILDDGDAIWLNEFQIQGLRLPEYKNPALFNLVYRNFCSTYDIEKQFNFSGEHKTYRYSLSDSTIYCSNGTRIPLGDPKTVIDKSQYRISYPPFMTVTRSSNDIPEMIPALADKSDDLRRMLTAPRPSEGVDTSGGVDGGGITK